MGREVKAQIRSEQGLQYNHLYLETINPAISNYGTPEEREVFKHCVNRHLRSKILYLSFRFNDAYKEIRKNQLLLIQLYETVVENSRLDVHQRFNEYAPRILYGQNRKLRKYLALGLRDLEQARQKTLIEYNRRPWLYLIKLNDLTEALKLVRHANRYYLLMALEIDSLYPPRGEKISYGTERRMIISGFPRRRAELLLMHEDNFFRIGVEKRDLLRNFRENPELEILDQTIPGWRLEDPPRLHE